MKSRMVVVALVALVAAFISSPAPLHGQPQSETLHEHQSDAMPASPGGAAMGTMNMKDTGCMNAPNPVLDDLVTKMNSAGGDTKIAAMAEIITALVNDRESGCDQAMCMMHMNTMGGHEAMQHPSPQR